MAIEITSTTDSEEAVLQAAGKKVEKVEEEKEQSATSTKEVETPEESDTSGKAKGKDTEAENNDDDELSDDDEESDSDEESKDDDDDEEEREAKPKKESKNLKRRFKRLTRKLSEKDREIEFLRSQLTQGQKPKSEESEETTTPIEVGEGKKPNPDDFETHEEFVEALTDWKIEQREAKKKAQEEALRAKTTYEKRVEDFRAKCSEFQKEHDDFDDVLAEVNDIRMSPAFEEAILTADLGPQVIYELAQDRDELERINRLGVVAAAREIGKIEARLQNRSSSKTTNEKKATKAPPPIAPVKSKSSAAKKSPDEMSYQEFKKWRES